MSSSTRPAMLAVLVAVTVLSSGLAGVALAESPSTPDAQTTENTTDDAGEEIVDAVVETLQTIETVEFTQTTETEFDGESTTSTQRVVADVDAFEKRVETLEADYGENTTTVINETHSAIYDADEETLNTYQYRSDRLLPQLELLGNESAVDYEYTGTDTVDGKDVYVLEAVPQQERLSDTDASMTIAIDAETHFPVKIETTVDSEDFSYNTTRTYENVSLNEDVPESAFELDVPEDTTEPSFEVPDVTTYDDHEALTASADLSVPDAELAGDYEFDSATVIDGDDYYSVSMTYTNGEESVYVTAQADSSFDWSQSEDYEEVSVGDTTGYYAEYDDYGFLRVDSDGQSYSVHGQLDQGETVDIATAIVEA